MITISCEGAPIFLAHRDDEGYITLDFSVAQSVMEWFNSLSKPDQNQAYFLADQRLFVFPMENGDWHTSTEEPDGTFYFDIGLYPVDACPGCLCYVPCDCEFRIVNEATLKTVESQALLGNLPSVQDIRDLVYTIRELEAQLKVEQEER